jgi:hypothetical protein
MRGSLVAKGRIFSRRDGGACGFFRAGSRAAQGGCGRRPAGRLQPAGADRLRAGKHLKRRRQPPPFSRGASAEWLPRPLTHNPAALCSPEGRKAMAALIAPFGGWGRPPQSGAASLRAGVNEQRNTGVSLCCTRPLPRRVSGVNTASDQHRARPARGLRAGSACGAHTASRVTAGSESTRSSGLATKEEGPRGYRRPLQRSLAAPGRSHGQCCLPWMTRRMISSSFSSL